MGTRLICPIILLFIVLGGCVGGGSQHDKCIGLSPSEELLAARVGNEVVPEYAADPVAESLARDQIVANHPEWPETIREAVTSGEIYPGMTRAQVAAAWGNGFVHSVRPVKFANRVRREKWGFDCAPNIAVAFFIDDSLIAVRQYGPAGESVAIPTGRFGTARPVRVEPLLTHEDRILRFRHICPDWDKPIRQRSHAMTLP